MKGRKTWTHPIGSVCHMRARKAMLSRGVTKADLWGFAHLLLIIFIATNCREIMANILKYGVLVRWFPIRTILKENSVFILGVISMYIIAFYSYRIEIRRGKRFIAAHNDQTIYSTSRNASPRMAPTLSEDDSEQKTSSSSPKILRNGDVLVANDKDIELVHETTAKRRLKDSIKTDSKIGSPTMVKSRSAREYSVSSIFELFEVHAEYLHLLRVTMLVIAMLVLPYLVVSYSSMDPLSGLGLLLLSVTWTLKLSSLHHVLHDVRMIKFGNESIEKICEYEAEVKEFEKYPENLSYRSFHTFLWMPTLCYQLSFPRRERIKWTKVLTVCCQLFLSCVIMKILVEQYMSVIVQNAFALVPSQQYSLIRLVGHFTERLLKLSLPTLYTWLLMFLSFFHYWMILLAELTRFEDAHFYDDWWNATGFREYWAKWNVPVHNFCARHVYKPLISRGVSRFLAGQIVFALSALAHEYLVVAPLRLRWTGLVFFAFLVQSPLAFFTDAYVSTQHPTVGNVIFWIIFCFTGQPLAVMIFYYLWNVKHNAFEIFHSKLLAGEAVFQTAPTLISPSF